MMIEINRKAVDKRARVQGLLHKLPFLSMAVNSETIADKIDSIYNSKEEDGEIGRIKVPISSIDLTIHPMGRELLFSVSNGVISHSERLNKEDALQFANALLSMCEQME